MQFNNSRRSGSTASMRSSLDRPCSLGGGQAAADENTCECYDWSRTEWMCAGKSDGERERFPEASANEYSLRFIMASGVSLSRTCPDQWAGMRGRKNPGRFWAVQARPELKRIKILVPIVFVFLLVDASHNLNEFFHVYFFLIVV